ncbi:MAG TPA: ABC transporter ATP-binding protein [Fimbriimonadaceae bacterium]|nr:ABC transporter ATP-binding protein [Fimbriimonadaceae bacterium]
MSAALACSGLSVGYGAAPVLSGVDLRIEPGEVVALLGPNGGGKSTLLRTLSGLLPILSGKVKVGGDDLQSLSPREIARRIGFVPQDEVWQFGFSVEEVVSMGRLPVSNGFFDTEEDRRAAEDAMRQAGCLDLRARPATELSGGERQRVLIARAIAQETPILFLDEPTSHLDPQYQVGAASLLRNLAAAGKAVLVAVHDLPVAAAMADRGVLVYGGKVTATKPIAALLESAELDQAYSSEFERLTTPSGRLVVVPKPRT